MNGMLTLQDGDAPITKTLIETAGQEYAVTTTETWGFSALDAYVRIRAIRDAMNAAMAALESDVMNQADEIESVHGVKVQVRNGSPSWDYSHDSRWQQMKAQEIAAAEQRKQREALLRVMTEEVADLETGEILAPAVQQSLGNRTIALTFPK